jgi:nucleoside-triphosphatase
MGTKILLTGPPGCGKTTAIMRLAELFQERRTAGFYTREIREADQRTGFEAVTLSGRTTLLSSIHKKSWVSVGKYGVDVLGFEELILPELDQNPDEVDVFLIDEIGKMECFCAQFVACMKRLLDLDVPLVATVSLHGKGFIQDVKSRDDIELMRITPENRAQIPKTVFDKLSE